jgi:hypothetical protein
MTSTLFTECFGVDGCENNQTGCGIGNIGQPLIDQFKKSLLEAGSSVIKKLRNKKQQGRGKPIKKKKKIQKGAGVKKNKVQKGRGKKPQKGRGKVQKVKPKKK